MMSWRWARRMALCGSGMVLCTVLACSSGSTAGGGGETAFCLSQDERPRLVAAAVMLNLVQPGSAPDRVRVDGREVSLDGWRRQWEKDFNSSCAELTAVAGTPSSGPGSSALPAILNILLGALIGFLSARYQDRVTGARQRARDLHAVNRAFVRATESYLQEWIGRNPVQPTAGPVYERRSELVAELRWLHTTRSRWRVLEQLCDLLSARFDDRITTGWDPVDADARVTRADGLRNELHALATGVNKVIRALEHPFLPHSGMRTPSTPLERGPDH